jgi:hypothetical protein
MKRKTRKKIIQDLSPLYHCFYFCRFKLSKKIFVRWQKCLSKPKKKLKNRYFWCIFNLSLNYRFWWCCGRSHFRFLQSQLWTVSADLEFKTENFFIKKYSLNNLEYLPKLSHFATILIRSQSWEPFQNYLKDLEYKIKTILPMKSYSKALKFKTQTYFSKQAFLKNFSLPKKPFVDK